MIFPVLYNIDSKGRIRTWQMEVDGKGSFRTISGLDDGKKVTSEWKKTVAKNVGKKNATTEVEQAIAEVQAAYTKKLEAKYYESLEHVGSYKFIQPMLAATYNALSDLTYPLYSQPKLDGIRAIITKDGITSRRGKPIVSCPHIQEQLKILFDKNPSIVLDGELYNHDLRDDFNRITSIVKQLKPTQEDFDNSKQFMQYHVYDMVEEGLSYLSRWTVLDCYSTLFATMPSVKIVPTVKVMNQQDLDQQFGELIANGYEGQMIRLGDSVYEPKRSKGLMKRKEFFDEEFEVDCLEEGKGNWAGYAKSVQCKTKDGKVFGAGIKGSQAFTKQLLEDARNGKIPKYATVRYPNYTPDGIPRFGVAVAFWDKERDY